MKLKKKFISISVNKIKKFGYIFKKTHVSVGYKTFNFFEIMVVQGKQIFSEYKKAVVLLKN